MQVTRIVLKGWFSLAHKYKHKHMHKYKQVRAPQHKHKSIHRHSTGTVLIKFLDTSFPPPYAYAYHISSNNSRPSINRLPRIIAPPPPLAIFSFSYPLPLKLQSVNDIVAGPRADPFAGISVAVNLHDEAEMESDPVTVISNDLGFDAEDIDIEH